jgi:hypothetical protein
MYVVGIAEETRTPDLPGNAGTLYFYLNPNMVGTRRLELLTFPATPGRSIST